VIVDAMKIIQNDLISDGKPKESHPEQRFVRGELTSYRVAVNLKMQPPVYTNIELFTPHFEKGGCVREQSNKRRAPSAKKNTKKRKKGDGANPTNPTTTTTAATTATTTHC
jgi:hypothetical protein